MCSVVDKRNQSALSRISIDVSIERFIVGSPQLDSLTTISNKILVFNEMNHTGPFVHVFDDNVHFRNIYGLDLRMIQASLSY